MRIRFLALLTSLLAIIPPGSFAELTVFDLNSVPVDTRDDSSQQSTVVHFRADDFARKIRAVERIDSAYLIADVVVEMLRGDSAGLCCLKIAAVGANDEIRLNTSFHEFNLEYSKPRQVTLDIKDLVQYWQKDASLIREFVVTKCTDDSTEPTHEVLVQTKPGQFDYLAYERDYKTWRKV